MNNGLAVTINAPDYLQDTYSMLIEQAKHAMHHAYSKYSHFKVGSALLTKDGSIFSGCNIENSSYGATMCAERTAIFKAVSEGHNNIEMMAIVSSNDDFTYPCGMCRQVMSEFNLDLVIVLNKENDITVTTLRKLLPYAFTTF